MINQFIGLQNGYHGETGLALSVSDVGIFKQPYKAILHDVPFIQNIGKLNESFTEEVSFI